MESHAGLRFSVLDLAPILAGGTAAKSFANTLDLAQHVERWGYHRYWLAEHHNIPGVASAATAVLIGYVAGGTSTIRVGAGGIMLPNHPPLVIAEQFGTLESLYPGRIDLGLGRAPGGDMATMRALRRYAGAADAFPEDVQELLHYFAPPEPGQRVRAIPGTGLQVPIYLLGSSLFSATLAAALGLPFAFASHFAPDQLLPALHSYRANFRPSEHLAEPYVIVGANLFAADTDAQAARLFTSAQRQFLKLIRGMPGELEPPVESLEGEWSPAEKQHVEQMTRYSAVGSPERVRERLAEIVQQTATDELILTGQIYDHRARLRSYEIGADALRRLNASSNFQVRA